MKTLDLTVNLPSYMNGDAKDVTHGLALDGGRYMRAGVQKLCEEHLVTGYVEGHFDGCIKGVVGTALTAVALGGTLWACYKAKRIREIRRLTFCERPTPPKIVIVNKTVSSNEEVPVHEEQEIQ